MLTQAELKSLVHYDPETGIFTWLPRPVVHSRHKIWNIRFAGKQAGHVDTLGYNIITLGIKKPHAHRLAWLYVYGYLPLDDIDHIDGNRNNNRIINLREATRSENLQNISTCRSDNKCGVLGVGFIKATNKYRAKIKYQGKQKHLGCFDTAEQAHRAYLEAKRKYHPFGNL